MFSSLLFAITVPINVIGVTLLYFELRESRPVVSPEGVSTSSSDTGATTLPSTSSM
jgi:hypothetical protein